MAVGGEWYGIADENNKMGKSKGLEFDNVFVTVTRPPVKDEDIRALYVAMACAKR